VESSGNTVLREKDSILGDNFQMGHDFFNEMSTKIGILIGKYYEAT
jgi:hypothetical protein